MVIDHTDFALTTVAYLLACVHGYGAVIWAIGNYIFCHYRINCVAAMILTLSLVALAVMDISCGPAGHHECYVKCFTFPGGHYLLAFVPIFFAYTLLLGDVFLGTFFHVFFEFGCLGRWHNLTWLESQPWRDYGMYVPDIKKCLQPPDNHSFLV